MRTVRIGQEVLGTAPRISMGVTDAREGARTMDSHTEESRDDPS